MKHRDQTLALLQTQIGNADEVKEIQETAEQVVQQWVNPLSGGKEEINGLIYGLVQSGKTGVLTVTGAMGADDGYSTIIILTSDNEPLYEQTLDRAREAFPGMDIMGKGDFKDQSAFLQRIKTGTCVLVTTKNSSRLGTLIENFKKGRVKGLRCLIIDDEADQASLNTKARKPQAKVSTINGLISELRDFFEKNTYLQVTATPQALFLQTPNHDFRPKFTVLSHPGKAYVGGDDFFGDDADLVREFDLADITALSGGAQPSPSLVIPASLLRALDTFIVGATYKRAKDADQNCAFLCHVSTRTADHKHIVDLLHKYRAALSEGLRRKDAKTISRLRAAYDDLSDTHDGIKTTEFSELIENIKFFSPGIAVKLVNGDTDEDVAVRSPFNLFVGGNKLGRGVTIKNLLVSYYGRNPKSPQADTVLQHARMYGYRRKDIGLLRLFLPPQLHTVFKAINEMERGLRGLIARRPDEFFRGMYVESSVKPTRTSVLAPGAIGVYAGGSTYNPAQVKRDVSVKKSTTDINHLVKDYEVKQPLEVSVSLLRDLVSLTLPDESASQRIWNQVAIGESLMQFAKLKDHVTGYLFLDVERDLQGVRRETQGILSGGEAGKVPNDKLTLFLYRTKASAGREAAWWPQIRFPDGQYAFAFAI